MKRFQHYWILAGVLLLGAILRFWQLDLKPLWMDEVITALFSTGHTYQDVPTGKALPLSAFEQVFSLNWQATCAQIGETIAVQSVHPPLFFCGMHHWLRWVDGLPLSWVWKLRSLPALFGVGAIAALYLLNRLAFSPKAGLMGAALMAVSPFAVYLSQEARHYTLPMLLVILALVGLYLMLIDLQKQRFRTFVWLGWIGINSLGFYVHYFFLLAFFAQSVTLLLWASRIAWSNLKQSRTEGNNQGFHSILCLNWRSIISSLLLPCLIAILLVGLTYLPWLSTFLSHVSRPETDWMKVQGFNWQSLIAPLYQLLIGWIAMVAAFPVEQQPFWIIIFWGVLMLLFIVWLSWQIKVGFRHLWRSPQSHLGAWMLGTFTLIVVLEFLAIAYLFRTDLTQTLRYNFIYFPAVCALIGACLSERSPVYSQTQRTGFQVSKNLQPIAIVLFISLLSSFFVVQDWVFQKSYNPNQVAQNLSIDPTNNRLVISVYQNYQDMALGLSFALELHRQEQQEKNFSHTHFALLPQTKGYDQVWADLAQLKQPFSLPINLWVISPGLKRRDFRSQLFLRDRAGTSQPCDIDPAQYHRLGVPYQLYRCGMATDE
jgi:uncharacterized membrane protein